MKSGAKRRRTNQEIEDERVAKAEREAELNQKLAAMASMEARMQQMENQAQNNQAAADILNSLVERGLAEVDENGNIRFQDNGGGGIPMSNSL